MKLPLYEVSEDRTFSRDKRTAAFLANDVVFWCPCGKRVVWAGEKHGPKRERGGALTLAASVGSPAGMWIAGHARPELWCHFSIQKGIVTIHDDCLCPGRDL